MFLEQTPKRILNYSSQYSSDHSHSYALGNICSGQQIYPSYGDSGQALVFRTYGPWWMNLPSYREHHQGFQRNETNFTSRDFIEIEFEHLVYQCSSLNIYETYNPGSVEVVYVGKEENDGEISWHQVWKFPQPFHIVLRNNEEFLITNGQQQMKDFFPEHMNSIISIMNSLDLNTDNQLIRHIHTKHPYPPAARFPRILKIPLKDQVSFPIKYIRIEFDHCTANYYIEIDTIKLCGDIFPIESSQSTQKLALEQKSIEKTTFDLTQLPFDILFQINSYLDLYSLIQLSSTCRYFREQCLHSLQFCSLDLQPYWNKITNESIENFFIDHCSKTRCLSLAWTQSISFEPFQQLLMACSDNLIQLNFACCQYLTGDYLRTIVDHCSNIRILNLESCISLTNLDFLPLKDLKQIRSLNVYRTKIDYRTLLPLIYVNQDHFEYINLGSCPSLIDTIGIVKMLFGRCKTLRSIDLWRAHELNQNAYLSISGLDHNSEEEENHLMNLSENEREHLAMVYSLVEMPFDMHTFDHLKYLQEIDIGWTNPPPGFIQRLVQQAGSSLVKIFLTACRNISNEDIYSISQHCPQLRQLDILGSNIIIPPAIECILRHCSKIEFIDLSFCSKISSDDITNWILQYKHCFKRSYTPITNDDIYTEFA